jgi:Mlc titration factor MtfA (ptsG expression regulator)
MYFAVCALLIVLLAWYLFRKPAKPAVVAPVVVVDEVELNPAYRPLLDGHVDYYHNLDTTARKRFEAQVNRFLQNTNIEGVGTDITDLDRVLIASSAIIPIFGLGDWQYNNLTNVILYPDAFDEEYQYEGEERSFLGMVGNRHLNGQMLLSRSALMKGFSSASGKENVAIHEFVHLLDGADGATDGVPEHLVPPEYAQPWLSLMHREMHRIQEGHSDINPYALTNEAEFFAVAAEYFFEKPEKFRDKHPELYEHLSLIFKQEPVV